MRSCLMLIGALALWPVSAALIAVTLAGAYYVYIALWYEIPSDSSAPVLFYLGMTVVSPFVLLVSMLLGVPLAYFVGSAVMRLIGPWIVDPGVHPPSRS